MTPQIAAQVAIEYQALPDDEYDKFREAVERIIGFIDRIGLYQQDTTFEDLSMPLDYGSGRWGRQLEFAALMTRCGVKKQWC